MINWGCMLLEKVICFWKFINCIIEGIQIVILLCSGMEVSCVCFNIFQCRDYVYGCEIFKFVGFFFFIVIFVYSRLCSFELDYYIVSSGEIFIVNVFDDYLFGYCRG